MTAKTLKTKFSDRGLTFIPVDQEGPGTHTYEYNGKIFETWKVESRGESLGVFTFPVGTYPTRRKMSENFDPNREILKQYGY